MPLDPMSLIMFGLIAVLIIFMIRNGKKRQNAAREMQDNLRPGAEVMLQSGIFAVVDELDEETNRITVSSGNSTLVVHRNAIGQIITPVESSDEAEEKSLAPDDDPEFGERVSDGGSAPEASAESSNSADSQDSGTDNETKA